ncbi:MAG: diguanylate phosphodiesterase [Methylobacillus glycogenes]|nr:diguanylate phosphodiesterase [Methylobacillus glycogenes]
MLSILVYRSRLSRPLAQDELSNLVDKAAKRNQENGVSGILLFDGEHFFQYIEGPDKALKATYEHIRSDPLHHHVVTLLSDYAPSARFSNWAMQLIDARDHSNSIVEPISAGLTTPLPSHDRALKLIKAFASGRWKDHTTDFVTQNWQFETRPSGFETLAEPINSILPCQFALQPIVDPLRYTISSVEALIRSATGGPPYTCFENLPATEHHLFDLESKRNALELASRLNIGDCKLSINLLPMSLVSIPNAVDQLLANIEKFGLTPQQVIVEVTEEEAISHFDHFELALKKLRSVGISVAIDDFGAGFAGLSLLAKFQPEKLKIDRLLVTDIHQDGPKQAIVKAIVECCKSLGITTIAEGIETPEEWLWLQAAGVELFQGFLFAKPLINGIPPVSWPILTK